MAGFAEQVSVPVVHAAVLSALNLAGSARWKDWGVVHILEVGALTVDFLLTGLANLGDGNGCAHHCEYRKPSANRGQKCSDGSRCWARITTLYAAALLVPSGRAAGYLIIGHELAIKSE